MKQSKGEAILAFQLTAYKIPFEQEWYFHPVRRWRFDFALLDHKIGIEVEGGIWLGAKGGHTSGTGYTKDLEKYNEASQLGWKLLRFTPQQVKKGEAILKIKEAITTI